MNLKPEVSISGLLLLAFQPPDRGWRGATEADNLPLPEEIGGG
jgi:hypothetical protein